MIEQKENGLMFKELSDWVNSDLVDYKIDIENRISELGKSTVTLRKYLEGKDAILNLKESQERIKLSAVDSSSAIELSGEITNIFALSVHYSHNGVQSFKPMRVTERNDEMLNHLPVAIRNYLEIDQLKSTDLLTIADGSLWSFLMNLNKFLNDYVNGFIQKDFAVAEEMYEYFTDFNKNPFLKFISNPNIIAMSKTGVSTRYSQDALGNKDFSDVTLLTRVLKKGEYLIPQKLANTTTGIFGVHQEMKEVESEMRKVYKEELFVTHFKPHDYSKAYRVEGRKEVMEDKEKLRLILSEIKKQTVFRNNPIEPMPQFMADFLAKQIQSTKLLYSLVNQGRFNSLTYKNR